MNEMNLDLSGKIALVTGGSRGLGKAIAMAMAGKGAHAIICGRKQENLDKTVDEFHKMGLEVMALVANVGKSDQVKGMFLAVEERFGKLDILVNNEDLLKEVVKTIPIGRIAEIDDVVGTVLFLASGLSDFITGEVITVDGGSMA